MLSLQEFLTSLEVNIEDHAVDNDHLRKKPEGILSDIGCLVMQTADHTLEQLEVEISGDDICLSELNKRLANLRSAVSRLVMKSLLEELQELNLC